MDEEGINAMSGWVEALRSGTAVDDRDAEFAAQLKQTQRRVFQIAYGVLLDPADAEEVAQDAFIRAYRRLGSLRDPDKFRAWVGRIAFRLALNRRRGCIQRPTVRKALTVAASPLGQAHGQTETSAPRDRTHQPSD